MRVEAESGMKGTGMGRNCFGEFELVGLEGGRCEAVVEVLECWQVLRGNYPFL